MKRAFLLAGIGPLLTGMSAYAATTQPPPKRVVVVGNCKPTVTKFDTIGAALAAVPANATVYVCPGVYPEQLNVTRSVSLIGVEYGSSSGPIIEPPAAGLAPNAQNSSNPSVPYAAQIAVVNAGVVNITNITVDGTNNQIAGCSPILVGILYQSTGGALQNSRLVNQSLVNGSNELGGCQSGNAIELLGSGIETVKVTGNDVAGFQKNGITVYDVNATISNNTVTGQGPTAAIAQNAIEADNAISLAISQNIVSDVVYTGITYGATGILVYDSPKAKISANIGTNTQGLIYDFADAMAASDAPMITSNKVQATHTFDGIDVCGVANAIITGNTVNGSDESAIHIDSECIDPNSGAVILSAATVGGNKINGTCAGILVGPNSSVATGMAANTFYNTITETQTGSDSCTNTTPQAPAARGERQGRRVVRIH